MPANCQSCRFFGMNRQIGKTICMRFPPKVALGVNPMGGHRTITVWPTVTENHYCGEYVYDPKEGDG